MDASKSNPGEPSKKKTPPKKPRAVPDSPRILRLVILPGPTPARAAMDAGDSAHQRKIELQSADDLAYLIANVRRAAAAHLDEAFPPVEGAQEEDELRTQIEALVDEVSFLGGRCREPSQPPVETFLIFLVLF